MKKRDTVLGSENPLEAEVKIKVLNHDKPLQAWIVMDVDSANGHVATYKRVRLNCLTLNFEKTAEAGKRITLVSGNLPKNIKAIKLYIWNNAKQNADIIIEKACIYRLFGEGINVVAAKK